MTGPKLFIIVATVGFACGFASNTSAILEDGKSELRRMNATCELTLDNRSVNYFRSRLDLEEPNFIYFFITFNGTDPKSVRKHFIQINGCGLTLPAKTFILICTGRLIMTFSRLTCWMSKQYECPIFTFTNLGHAI